MGCSLDDTMCEDNEFPRHSVRLQHGFWIAETEVPQQAWEKVMGYNHSTSLALLLPVDRVSLVEAERYCALIGGRLPLEEEWEYAARAGNAGKTYGGDADVGWSVRYGGYSLHPVKRKLPNAWGLYDMLGNAWEWTDSRFVSFAQPRVDLNPVNLPAYRWQVLFVARSGLAPQKVSIGTARVKGFDVLGLSLRVSERDGFAIDERQRHLGFRCVADEQWTAQA
jgi:formylglycine-generating enzyme required for sulfatase activity